jgi:hypothetical protein
MQGWWTFALAAVTLFTVQTAAFADCCNSRWFCHLRCYPTKRCCSVPCPSVLCEETFGYFPTQWRPWPVTTVITPAVTPAPEALPLPGKKMPNVR